MSRPLHDAGVARLQAALRATDPRDTIRLAKPSSNLFRFGKRDAAVGLPTDGLDSVIALDTEARTIEVGGLITYERLVAATLPHKLVPTVVPQLKTITVGGAVAGLGIESSSFREGLPHEAVREMDVLTGDGRVLTVFPGDDLFQALPNSYGTLGYAVRLVLDLDPVSNEIALTHVRFSRPEEYFEAMHEICETRIHDGAKVDYVDGVVFSPTEMYMTVGSLRDDHAPTSDYTGQSIYYQSLRRQRHDRLTIHDYLWRWDTDWFWCSAAFGVQNRFVRRLWPRYRRRSDVYRKLVRLDRKTGLTGTLARLGGGRREAVIQDVEVPIRQASRFLEAFCAEVPIRPIWVCPLALSSARQWPLYPLGIGETYVNFGFWATVALDPHHERDHHNRRVEELVDDCGGHKSLYSTVHYGRDEFWRKYGGETYHALKKRYDATGRLPMLFDKVVTDSATG